MNNKAQLQISFGWIFAIIVGIFVLFLAVYFSVKLFNIGQTSSDASVAKQIGILTNPLEISFESGKTSKITLASETRINNKCDEFGDFGLQKISVSQKSFNKWSETDIGSSFKDKYIFSEESAQGKEFYLFSIPFKYPFKVADMIILTSKRYCFLDAPEEVKEDISIYENVETENCKDKENYEKVCFSYGNDCDVQVNYAQREVIKNNEKMYFTGELIYGAIFSDKKTYECQVQRLLKRTEQLSLLYQGKARNLYENGCEISLENDLIYFNSLIKNVKTSKDLVFIEERTNEIALKNIGECKLW